MVCEYGLDLSGSRWGPVAYTSKRFNETSGSIKGEELLEHVRDYQFVKGENASWSSLPDACNSVTSQRFMQRRKICDCSNSKVAGSRRFLFLSS
jgi:hypothetical protein